MKQKTIGELIGSTEAARLEKAGSCTVSLERTYHELKRATVLDRFKSLFKSGGMINEYYLIFKFSVTSGSGSTWEVYIRTNPDFNLTEWESNPVQIYCGCPDFKYRCAYNLEKTDSLFKNERLKAELGPAITEKPKRATEGLLCKHSVAALRWLVSNYSSVMKTI